MMRTHRKHFAEKRALETGPKPYKVSNMRFFIRHARFLAALTQRGCLVNVNKELSELGEPGKFINKLTVVLPSDVTLETEVLEMAEKSGLKQTEITARPFDLQLVYA